jgi:hypothetical protein
MNAARNKPWREALNRAIARAEAHPSPKHKRKLAYIADALLSKAAKGDIMAIRELGDRLDGRPSQGVELSGSIDFAGMLEAARKRKDAAD